MEDIQIRVLDERDSLEELTALLHRAYAELGAMGFRYKAVDQSVETTRARIANGECYVAVRARALVGTAVLFPPSWRPAHCEWYRRPEVAVLSQFAVEPQVQRHGLGSRLISHLEARAAELGAEELTIDTAEGATHLVGLYERRGYRHLGFANGTTPIFGVSFSASGSLSERSARSTRAFAALSDRGGGAELAEERARRDTRDGAELGDEMRLIVVAGIDRDARPGPVSIVPRCA
jgi:GNAT superfamily N-acetyltransferase